MKDTFTVDEIIQFAVSVKDDLFKPTITGLKQFLDINRSSLNAQAQPKNRTLGSNTRKH